MLIALYLVATIIGVGLLIAGFFQGDHSADAGHDGWDAHHGDSDHGAAGFPILSFRFWTYCLSAFGIVGLLTTYLTQSNPTMVLTASSITGLVAGLGAFFIFRVARKAETDSIVRESDILGQIADVQVAIRGVDSGRIRIESKGEFLDLLAKTHSEETFLPGSKVVIVDLDGATAIVASTEAVFENA